MQEKIEIKNIQQNENANRQEGKENEDEKVMFTL